MSPFPPIPCFHPHALLRGGHRQTILGMYLPSGLATSNSTRHVVELADGDALALHETLPTGPRQSDRVAILAHGVSGCHSSPYMVRIAARLQQHGVRVFRLDARGCGAGAHLAKFSTHAGRSDDLIASLKFVRQLCPHASISLVGFSLGGGHVLKGLAENDRDTLKNVDGFAVSPPIELLTCSRHISQSARGLYDRKIAAWLYRQIRIRKDRNEQIAALDQGPNPKSIYDFDDRFTAPLAGFDSADHYYRECSTAPRLDAIEAPLRIIVAKDDPMIPFHIFENLDLPSNIELNAQQHGGHLGFVGAKSSDEDRRWMDWRVLDWVTRELQPV